MHGILFVIILFLIVGIGIGFMIGFSRAMRDAARHFQKSSTIRPTLAWILISVSSLLLIASFAISLHTLRFTRIAQRTTGSIIEMRPNRGDSGDVTYAPTFRFQDAIGSEHTVSSHFYSAPPEFRVGDTVKVLYRGDDPQSARIESYWQVWGLPTLLAIIGGIQLPTGIIALCWPKIMARFRRTKDEPQTTNDVPSVKS
jgi:hypothetical protein